MSAFDQGEVLNNPQRDPLLNETHEAARELVRRLAHAAHGFQRESVEFALILLLSNCVRQHAITANSAAAIWDELSAKGKAFLLEQHYEAGASGLRKNIFPYLQRLNIPLLDVKAKQAGR